VALQKYREQHGQFPDVSKATPYNVAGVVVPILNENGTMPASVSIRCPGMGSPVSCQLTLTSLKAMSDADFERYSPSLSMCYAYSLGHRDEEGVYHGPAGTRQTSWSQTPIMADRPPAEGILHNSINHGGGGQNVLFADGHVIYMAERVLGRDDIFINRDGRVSAGLDARDIVLGYSSARP
jgi:prepilin-type processing-associated H-X9-DG protein